MRHEERALPFRCGGDWLTGILSLPDAGGAPVRGVLVVVGGPQYRIGSHRQFVLLARHLADNGVAAMRFDYRGMGDSGGDVRDFTAVDEDLRCAVDAFMAAVPGMRDVVLWGLCDGASAAAMYAPSDARVRGLVLLNPWVRTDDGLARATLKHHYRDRLRSPEFWRKLRHGQVDWMGSLRAMVKLIRTAFAARPHAGADAGEASLPQRMQRSLAAFGGHTLLVIGGADMTGREFCDLALAAPEWKRTLDVGRVGWRRLDGADHTFSRRDWRDQVAHWTSEWLRSW